MAARITRFTSRAERLRREDALALRQLLLPWEDTAPELVGRVLVLIDSRTATTKTRWAFIMISPEQNRWVTRWLLNNAKRYRVSSALWSEMFCHLRWDTGEIIMDRKEMMEATKASSSHVSEALSELVSVGALIRRQEGRQVRWFMNPNVGTSLTGKAREDAQKAAPELHTI